MGEGLNTPVNFMGVRHSTFPLRVPHTSLTIPDTFLLVLILKVSQEHRKVAGGTVYLKDYLILYVPLECFIFSIEYFESFYVNSLKVDKLNSI